MPATSPEVFNNSSPLCQPRYRKYLTTVRHRASRVTGWNKQSKETNNVNNLNITPQSQLPHHLLPNDA